MNDLLIISISLFAVCSIIYCWYIHKAIIGLRKKETDKGGSNNTVYSIIVPFRNEGKNLERLQNQLRKLDSRTFEVIWVNDHSDIPTSLELKNNESLIDLKEGEGKKSAIYKGIQQAGNNKVITLDADVVIPETFEKMLLNWNREEMYVMPVVQGGDLMFQKFIEHESMMIMGLTVGLVQYGDPLMANGAAIGFDRMAYLKNYEHMAGKKYASGDDMFMLHAIKKVGNRVGNCPLEKGIIYSDAPENMGAFLDQRVRWAGKSLGYKDVSTNVFGMATFLMYVSLILSLVFASSETYLLIICGIWLTKWLFDYLLLFLVPVKARKIYLIAFICWQLIYPVYSVIIPIISIFYRPLWKGRRI